MMEWIMDTGLEQQVRLRAYELWLRDGRADGRHSDHWHAAECEILSSRAQSGRAAAPAAATKRKTSKTRSAKNKM
jgi:hypothetical protein